MKMRALIKPYFERPLIETAPFWILSLMVFLGPLFIWPGAQDSFVLAKFSFLHAMTWLLLGSVLIQTAAGQPIRLSLHPINGFLLAWFLWQILSVTWSDSPTLAWDQVRESGTLVLFAFLFQHTLAGDRRRLISLVWLLVLSGIGVSLWALGTDYFGAYLPNWFHVGQALGDWRDYVSTAGFGNTGHVADFLVQAFLAALILCFTVQGRTPRYFLYASLWLMAGALIIAWSVHSNLSLIICVILLAILLRPLRIEPRWRRAMKRIVPLTIGWIVVVAFFTINHPMNPHTEAHWQSSSLHKVDHESTPLPGIFGHAFSSPRWKEGGSTRVAIWLTTLEIIRQNPWLGVGAGNFTYVYPATTSEIVQNDPDLAPYSGAWTNAAHNEILQTWSETGIVGLFLLLALIGASFHTLIKRDGEEGFSNSIVLAMGLCMLAAICLQAQMNFPLELPFSSYYLFALIGLPIILPQRGKHIDLLMPVSRTYPGVELGIMMKNMRVPTELHFAFSLPIAGRWVVGFLLAGACIVMAVCSTAPLRASVLYRPVYHGLHDGYTSTIPEGRTSLIEQSRAALDIDPTYTDCQSALTDLLIRNGDFEEANVELEKLNKRLNAIEVYWRRAMTLDAMGRGEESLPFWDVVFERQPQLVYQYPEAAKRWTGWKSTTSPE